MSEQDDFPERFHRDRREHGGSPKYIDNAEDEKLARLKRTNPTACARERRPSNRASVTWVRAAMFGVHS